MVYSCDSDLLSEGTKFCVSDETFTVGSSWNSVGGATVNLSPGESFATGLFTRGDALTVGACGSDYDASAAPMLPLSADRVPFCQFGGILPYWKVLGESL